MTPKGVYDHRPIGRQGPQPKLKGPMMPMATADGVDDLKDRYPALFAYAGEVFAASIMREPVSPVPMLVHYERTLIKQSKGTE